MAKTTFNLWLVHILPVLWLILGVLYARSLDAWAGIGVLILVLVSTAGLFTGTITWHITRKLWYAVLAVIVATALFFFLIALSVRM